MMGASVSQLDAMGTLATAAAADAMAEATDRPHQSACRNCGSPMAGPYCAVCGQAARDRSKSLLKVIGDALEDFLHFDSRVLRTLVLLLFLPGRMTRLFIQGRRVSFVPPLRLYLFSSLIFFLVLSLANVALFVVDMVERAPDPEAQAVAQAALEDVTRRMAAEGPTAELAAELETRIDEVTAAHGLSQGGAASINVGQEHVVLPPNVTLRMQFFVDLDTWRPNSDLVQLVQMQAGIMPGLPVPPTAPRSTDSPDPTDAADAADAVGTDATGADATGADATGADAAGADVAETLDNLFGSDWQRRLLRGIVLSLDHPEDLNQVMGDNLAKAMFVLMPLYAILLSIVHVRRRLYFVDHLTFALHLHAFLFVLLTIVVLVQAYGPGLIGEAASVDGAALFFLALATYAWIAMWRAYGQGVIKTTLKWLIVGWTYSLFLMVAVVAALIVSLPDV
ncbi:MAG: hypothetical protein RLY86_3011 [Pseudomonadota bacterium]